MCSLGRKLHNIELTKSPFFFFPHAKWWTLSHTCGSLIFLLLFSSHFTHKPPFFSVYWSQNRLSWGARGITHDTHSFPACPVVTVVAARTCLFMSFTHWQWAQCANVVRLSRIERVNSAEHLKRFSYDCDLSWLLPLGGGGKTVTQEIVRDGEAGKPERKTAWQGAVFDESLALCLLQAKNTTQPGLQKAWGGGGGGEVGRRGGGGGGAAVYICASVAPNPTAGG